MCTHSGRNYPDILSVVTHQADGRPSASVGLSVSVCGPSLCGVSRTVGTSWLLSAAFQPIEHAEAADHW